QLELVHALEVSQPRVVARVDERLITCPYELRHAAAEHRLLPEQVGLGLVLEGRLDHAPPRAADALRVGQRERERIAARVLLHRHETRNTRALGVLAPNEMART